MGLLRPAGSHVPLPGPDRSSDLPWRADYETWYLGSGTEALSAAVLLAVKRSRKARNPEVVLPAYGCPDLVAAVVAQGATPILVDLLPDCPYMDPVQVSCAISERTVAVIAVGFLGVPEQLDELERLCEKHDIWLIEDSAQCFPPDCARKPRAHCAILSFGRGKPINLMGGGALLIRRDLAKSTGVHAPLSGLPEVPVRIGYKWRIKRRLFNVMLGRLCYGVLKRIPLLGLGGTVYKPLSGLARIALPDELVAAGISAAKERPYMGNLYRQKLDCLSSMGWTHFMDDGLSCGQLLLRYGLLAESRETRNRAVDALNKEGFGVNGFYERALSEIAGVPVHLGSPQKRYPNAQSFADRLITLPSHEDVTVDDIDKMARTLKRVSRDRY